MRTEKGWILAPSLPSLRCMQCTWIGPAFPPGAPSLLQAMTLHFCCRTSVSMCCRRWENSFPAIGVPRGFITCCPGTTLPNKEHIPSRATSRALPLTDAVSQSCWESVLKKYIYIVPTTRTVQDCSYQHLQLNNALKTLKCQGEIQTLAVYSGSPSPGRGGSSAVCAGRCCCGLLQWLCTEGSVHLTAFRESSDFRQLLPSRR